MNVLRRAILEEGCWRIAHQLTSSSTKGVSDSSDWISEIELSRPAQKNARADAKLNLCSTSEEQPFMTIAGVSLYPVNGLDMYSGTLSNSEARDFLGAPAAHKQS